MRLNKRGEVEVNEGIFSLICLVLIGAFVIFLGTRPNHKQCNAFSTEVRTEVSQVMQNGERIYMVNYVDPETRVMSSETFWYTAVVKADVDNDKPMYVSRWTNKCMFDEGQNHKDPVVQIRIHKAGKLGAGFRSGKGGPVSIIE